MKHKVIDNFLDKEYFDSLVTLFTADDTMAWHLNRSLGLFSEDGKTNLFYMSHLLYKNNVPLGPPFEKLGPLLEKLEIKALIRVKANLYPNTHILYEHPMHVDTDFSHSAAIFSLNTCDGYTKLDDGTKIYSVANRILLFDASKTHCATTTTNVHARININMNYL